MIIDYFERNKKVTANQFAKAYLVDGLVQKLCAWDEQVGDDLLEKLTEKEIQDIDFALKKKVNALRKYLGYESLYK